MTADGAQLIGLPSDLPAGQADRPALLGERTVTYGELAADVTATAAALRALGARPGDRAAIWMDKQPRYAEAILAALRAGCAYVPLDGGQPAARAATILADASPVVLFTDARHLAALDGHTLPASVRAVVVTGAPRDSSGYGAPDGAEVCAWADFAARAPGATDAPAAQPDGPDGDALAALLYTSGSTGVPKGVKISHRNLANFTGWARTELDVGPDDVFANHASFNFDLSTFDLFTALGAGAAVWIIDEPRARDASELAAGIVRHGVTVWYSVPSVLNLLTVSGALTPERAAGLRYVLFAGEVYPMPQLRALAALLPEHTVLYNLYGPTETNVCTFHRVGTADLARDEPAPIGLPISNTRVSVVDEAGRAVTGAGAVGELVVEGDCVTPGYWGRESEPAAAGHRARRHATGDLVTREDGRLVYRGRIDRMVKLSGYRIELGEIEAAVLRHPAVADAAVVVADAPGGQAGQVGQAGQQGNRETQRRLALYYTLREGAAKPTLVQLKQHCARHLPGYMLPQMATVLGRAAAQRQRQDGLRPAHGGRRKTGRAPARPYAAHRRRYRGGGADGAGRGARGDSSSGPDPPPRTGGRACGARRARARRRRPWSTCCAGTRDTARTPSPTAS
uniref:Putative L-prolyl-AMP ligase n=1 Tax=Streptomyces griseoviridis TaxID=45398 RepID=B6VRQ7_STRGD|nr:putative L-prolyl-AMP ligase [Streptomyces griseoviridis]